MKFILSVSFLFISFVCIKAQETKPEKNEKTADVNSQFSLGDECGNESAESQTHDYRKGKVIKITNSNDLIVNVTHSNVRDDETEEDSDGSKLVAPQVFRIFLVGIKRGFNKTAINKFLTEEILNQEVEITGNTENSWKNKKDNSRKLSAVVWLLSDNDDITDISEYLLENGIAKYKPFESANLVSMVMPCRLQKAEERAKAEKLGIWAK